MGSEIRKVDGANIVVEVNTQQIRNEKGEVASVESATAFTAKQIDDNIANTQKQVDRWTAMKALLVV